MVKREWDVKTMKVCKYCGSENVDSASVCSSCGANEFKNKCSNCGTIYDEGKFCPKCGVKAGTKAKKCPSCGTEYYSTACPNCGYTNSDKNPAGMYFSTPVQPVKKRKTWLWVLGWICIFPVPLTILMLRNEKMNKWARIGIIAAAWILYFAMGMAGNSAVPTDNTPNTVTPSISEVSSSDSSNLSAVTDENASTQSMAYAEDEVVNRFMEEFNKNSDMQITDLEMC